MMTMTIWSLLNVWQIEYLAHLYLSTCRSPYIIDIRRPGATRPTDPPSSHISTTYQPWHTARYRPVGSIDQYGGRSPGERRHSTTVVEQRWHIDSHHIGIYVNQSSMKLISGERHWRSWLMVSGRLTVRYWIINKTNVHTSTACLRPTTKQYWFETINSHSRGAIM